MFQPGGVVPPGRGHEPRGMSPEEMIAANPLAGYPDGFSPSSVLGRGIDPGGGRYPDPTGGCGNGCGNGSDHDLDALAVVGATLAPQTPAIASTDLGIGQWFRGGDPAPYEYSTRPRVGQCMAKVKVIGVIDERVSLGVRQTSMWLMTIWVCLPDLCSLSHPHRSDCKAIGEAFKRAVQKATTSPITAASAYGNVGMPFPLLKGMKLKRMTKTTMTVTTKKDGTSKVESSGPKDEPIPWYTDEYGIFNMPPAQRLTALPVSVDCVAVGCPRASTQ